MDINLLEKLCNINSASGDEENVRKFIIDEIRDYIDELEVDALGNIIAFKRGLKPRSKKLMVCAHMDEVGFIVTHITKDGYIKFSSVGGVDSNILLGKRVNIGKNNVCGIIGVKPIHLMDKNDKGEEEVKISDLYIDIGASNDEEAIKYVNLGDYIYFDTKFVLDDNNRIIKSKALDDRVGCFILINIIKSELEFDTYFAFTTQEEIGARGGKVASYKIDPDSCIVVESTTAFDMSEEDNDICSINKGAVVSFMDRGAIYDKEYFNIALDFSKTGEKVQIKKGVCGGNDSSKIHISRNGVRTIAISLPCRYIHSAMSIALVEDVKSVESLTRFMMGKII